MTFDILSSTLLSWGSKLTFLWLAGPLSQNAFTLFTHLFKAISFTALLHQICVKVPCNKFLFDQSFLLFSSWGRGRWGRWIYRNHLPTCGPFVAKLATPQSHDYIGTRWEHVFLCCEIYGLGIFLCVFARIPFWGHEGYYKARLHLKKKAWPCLYVHKTRKSARKSKVANYKAANFLLSRITTCWKL